MKQQRLRVSGLCNCTCVCSTAQEDQRVGKNGVEAKARRGSVVMDSRVKSLEQRVEELEQENERSKVALRDSEERLADLKQLSKTTKAVLEAKFQVREFEGLSVSRAKGNACQDKIKELQQKLEEKEQQMADSDQVVEALHARIDQLEKGKEPTTSRASGW